MLRSCQYCGKIHDTKFVCSQKPQRKKYDTEATKFRNTNKWHIKREEIKKRDLYLCQICIRELHNTINKYNTKELEVHHNVSLKEDFNKRLDNDNLLTVCKYHHEMCENGKIAREEIQRIINEQEKK